MGISSKLDAIGPTIGKAAVSTSADASCADVTATSASHGIGAASDSP